MVNTKKYKPVDIIKISCGRYKIGMDKACESKLIKKADPWYLVIKCKNGEIYPFSNLYFGFHCIKKIIRNSLHENQSEFAVRNWSDNGEAIFLFESGQFELIAKYAKPIKVRRLSEKHKLILVKAGCQALKAYRKINSKGQESSCNQVISS